MDTSYKALKTAQDSISKALHRAVETDRLTRDQAQAAIDRIQPREYLEVGSCNSSIMRGRDGPTLRARSALLATVKRINTLKLRQFFYCNLKAYAH